MPAGSPKEIVQLKDYLVRKHTRRNELFQTYRSFYNSQYFAGSETENFKLIYNLLAAAVDRYTDFLSQTPEFRVLPMGTTREHLSHADNQEKYLMSQYQLNDFEIFQSWLVNLQSMLGMFAVAARPIFEDQSKEQAIHLEVPPPEYVFPMPRTDNVNDLDSVIILGNTYEQFGHQFTPEIRHDQKIHQTNTIIYHDKNQIVVLRDGEVVHRVGHDLGFIPVVIGQNRIKPHYIEGTSDMEHAAGLQKFYNELISWQADMIEYASDPITVIYGNTGGVPLQTGRGQQWNLPEGARAQLLQWDGTPPSADRLLSLVQRGIEDLTFLGDTTFGRDVPSGTSGSAVRSLTSGIQAAILRKQVMLGSAYNRLNAVIFKMTEKLFPNREIVVRGIKRQSMFYSTYKGVDTKGNYRTQTIFPPGILDQGSRVDIELTKMQNRLQSKHTTMENIGILSPQDELELIRREQEEEMALEALAKGGMQNPLGLPKGKAAEFNSVADQLRGAGGPETEGEEAQLIQAIQQIPKIRGDVFLESANNGRFVVVLSSMMDKSTIVNRLPKEFKGKITFRRFEDGDEALTPIVQAEEPAQA